MSTKNRYVMGRLYTVSIVHAGPRDFVAYIRRNGAIIGSGSDSTARGALARARMAMYNAAHPFRRGPDLQWLARYNARFGESARSLHR